VRLSRVGEPGCVSGSVFRPEDNANAVVSTPQNWTREVPFRVVSVQETIARVVSFMTGLTPAFYTGGVEWP